MQHQVFKPWIYRCRQPETSTTRQQHSDENDSTSPEKHGLKSNHCLHHSRKQPTIHKENNKNEQLCKSRIPGMFCSSFSWCTFDRWVAGRLEMKLGDAAGYYNPPMYESELKA